jgi:hypothetical protein
MANFVCDGASLMCTFGLAPGSLSVLPTKRIKLEGKEAASIMDFTPMVNISDFGNCMSLLNPIVAAATAKNLGVLEPQKCIPMTVSPWIPGNPTVLHTNQPALTDQCINLCAYMGIITVTFAGQATISCQPGPDMSAMMADLEKSANDAQANAQKEMEDAMKEDEDKK